MLKVSLAAVLAAFLLLPASAGAAWQLPPFDVSPAGQAIGEESRVAMDPFGNAHYVWIDASGAKSIIQTRIRAPNGTLGPVQNLSAPGEDAAFPRLAAGAGGDVQFVWRRASGSDLILQTRRRAADGTLSAVQDLTAGNLEPSSAEVAVDPAGNAHFAWDRSDGANNIVQTSRLAADGTLGSTVDVSAAGQDAAGSRVAVDPAGNAHFVWRRSNGTNNIIQSRKRNADGTFAVVKDISVTGQNADEPNLAVDPAGNAHYIWSRFNGSNTIVQTREQAFDGTLLPVDDLSAAGQNANTGGVGVDAAGDTYFGWTRSNGTNVIAQGRRRAADGTLGTVHELSAAGQDSGGASVVVDSIGNAHYFWTRSNGTHTIGQTRRLTAAGALDAVQDLSATGQNVFSFELAVDASGNAAAAWTHGGESGDRVHSSFNPVPPGALPTPGPWRLPGFDLSPAGNNASFPHPTIDAAGNAFFSWTSSEGPDFVVRLRRRSANGTLGVTQDLSAGGQSALNPMLDVDPAGNAHVVWERFDGSDQIVQTRRRAPDGTLGAVQDLSAAGQSAFDPRVAVDPAGNAHFVWRRNNGPNTIIQMVTRAADGTLGPVQDLSDTGNSASDPHVAVDPAGNAHFVWQRFDGSNQIVQARLLRASGVLESVQNLSAPGLSAIEPALAVDRAGNAHFTWQRSNGSNSIVQTRRLGADGTLGGVQDLSTIGQDALRADVAVDSAGNAYFTWDRSDGANPIAQLRRRAVDGTVGSVEQLAANAIESRVAADFAGNAYFSWQRFDGANNRVEARLRTAAGVLGAPQSLSAAGQPGERPELAVNQAGRAVVTWRRSNGSEDIAQASVNSGPVPVNPGGPGGPGGGGPAGGGGQAGADVVRPAFRSLTMSPKTLRAAARGGSLLSKAKIGTRVRYSLSEAATVTFTVERRRAGRRVGGKCRKRTRGNSRRRKCDLRLKGSFRQAGKAGRNSLRFSGRLRRRKLSPSRYNLVATAKDAAGNVSKSKRARFRIVRR